MTNTFTELTMYNLRFYKMAQLHKLYHAVKKFVKLNCQPRIYRYVNCLIWFKFFKFKFTIFRTSYILHNLFSNIVWYCLLWAGASWVWFKQPRAASHFTPREGTIQVWQCMRISFRIGLAHRDTMPIMGLVCCPGSGQWKGFWMTTMFSILEKIIHLAKALELVFYMPT